MKVGDGYRLQDYGERMYMTRLGRFMSVDPLIVRGKKYLWLSPYSFAGLNPVNAVDLDGLEAYFIHGTWSNPSTFPSETELAIKQITSNRTVGYFGWSGENKDEARKGAAEWLATIVKDTRRKGEPLTLVGHSHGGNVAIMAANILYKKYNMKVDYLITFNTPVREYRLEPGAAWLHINIYNPDDDVQRLGGSLKRAWIAEREFPGAVNIRVSYQGDISSRHATHQRPELWKDKIREKVISPPGVRVTPEWILELNE